MKYQVQPPDEVREEIETRNTDITNLLEDAKLTLLDMQGEESGAVRLFIERGYSPAFSQWLIEEAREREKAQGGAYLGR